METVSAKRPRADSKTLVDRVIPRDAQADARARAARLPAIELNSRAASDLLLLATGGFSPLEGFTDFEASSGVVEDMRLADGTIWPFPILLQTDAAQAKTVQPGS